MEPLKIGIIGTGKWGKNHVRNLITLGHEVYIYDTNIDRMSEISKDFNCKSIDSMEKLFEVCEAVTIATLSDTHYELVKTCLNANKHVMVEKPLALNSANAKELIELAMSKKLILATGHVFRFTDTVKELEQLFRIKYKNIKYISMRFLNPQKPRSDSNVLFNLAIHLFDILDMLVHEDPELIQCQYNEYFGSIIVKYKKIIAHLEVACNHQHKFRDMYVLGTDESKELLGGYYDLMKSDREPLLEEFREFCHAVQTKTFPSNAARIGYFGVKLCELAQESSDNNKTIKVEL